MYSKTELTEIRKQICSRYLGTPAYGKLMGGKKIFMSDLTFGDLSLFERKMITDITLQLKPLSSITDEDAIAVATILYPKNFNDLGAEYGKYYIKYVFCDSSKGWMKSEIFQYLQLKGYALPQLVLIDGKPVTLSVEQQIELGIIETKN